MSRWGDFSFTSEKDSVLQQFKKANRRGLQAVAIEVSGAAKKRTPVDTGWLRASIAWAVDDRERNHKGTWKGTTVQYRVTAPEGEARVGTNVAYAPWVHENLDAYHKTGEAKFIENAFTEKQEKAEQIMRLALEGKL